MTSPKACPLVSATLGTCESLEITRKRNNTNLEEAISLVATPHRSALATPRKSTQGNVTPANTPKRKKVRVEVEPEVIGDDESEGEDTISVTNVRRSQRIRYAHSPLSSFSSWVLCIIFLIFSFCYCMLFLICLQPRNTHKAAISKEASQSNLHSQLPPFLQYPSLPPPFPLPSHFSSFINVKDITDANQLAQMIDMTQQDFYISSD